MKNEWVPVTIDSERLCSECNKELPVGTRVLYSAKNQLFACLTHVVAIPKRLKSFSRMSEEERFLKNLGSISRRYEANIVETKLFNHLDSSLKATYIAVASNGVSLICLSNDEGLVQIKFGGSRIAHSSSFHLFVGKKEKNNLIEEIRVKVANVKTLLGSNGLSNMSVRGVLSMPKAEWPLFDRETKIGGVLLEGAHLENIFFTNHDPSTIDEVQKAFLVLKKNLGTNKI